jgi:fatty-acyl-CoA synthase
MQVDIVNKDAYNQEKPSIDSTKSAWKFGMAVARRYGALWFLCWKREDCMEGLLNITVGQLLSDMAERFPDREAVKYTDRVFRMTWKELDAAAVRIGKGLLALGIGKGDHVAIWATNVPEWLLLLFGTAKIGAVLVTVNTNYKVFEAEYLMRQSDTKCLVMSDGFKDVNYPDIVNELCPMLKDTGNAPLENPMLPYLKRIVYIGEKQIPGMLPWAELDRLADTCDEALYASISQSLTPDEVINMQYTSGTTGFPKRRDAHAQQHRQQWQVHRGPHEVHRGRQAVHSVCRSFIASVWCLAIMACLTHGSSDGAHRCLSSPIKVMKAVQNEQCTALHGVPTMFIAILDHPEFKSYTFPAASYRHYGRSPCPIKVMQQVVDVMGARKSPSPTVRRKPRPDVP